MRCFSIGMSSHAPSLGLATRWTGAPKKNGISLSLSREMRDANMSYVLFYSTFMGMKYPRRYT